MKHAVDSAFCVAIAGLFAAPYLVSFGRPELHYLVPDVLIAILVYLRFRNDTPRRLGLAISPNDLIGSALLFAVGSGIAFFVLGGIGSPGEIRISGHRPFFSLTQVLHQELVLRGLLLGTLAAGFTSRISLTTLAVTVAIAFAAIHPILLWWRWDLTMPFVAALTLWNFALATNLLFLRAGHIGFAFAVHAAWNLQRFGTHYGRHADGTPITEWESFVWIEGAMPTCLASAALLGIVLGLDAWKQRNAT